MKYSVYIELEPILIEDIEAPNEKIAEDIAFKEIIKHIKIDFVETTEMISREDFNHILSTAFTGKS